MKTIIIILILLCSCSPRTYTYRTVNNELIEIKIKQQFPYREITAFMFGGFIGLAIVVSVKGDGR